MQLNESTYQYIETVSSQIYGITREFTDCIKRAADMASNYHYIVYYAFVNQVREKQIEAVRKIKEMYEDTRHGTEAIFVIMHGTQESEFSAELSSVLLEFEDRLSELISYCESIPSFRPETANPRIADADDEIYQSFSQYKNIIDKYPLNEPDESDDVVSNLFYSFFKESVKIYEELFCEYDRILSNVGVELEIRRSSLTRKRLLSRTLDRFGDVKTVVSGIAGVVENVQKKNFFGAAEELVGIGTSLVEKHEDDLRESRGRKLIENIDNVGKTIELVDNILDSMGSDIKESSAASAMKLITASAALMGQDVIKLQELKDSGKLDIGINLIGLSSDVISIVLSSGIHNKLFKLPSAANNALGLYEAILKRFSDNDVHFRVQLVDHFLHEQAKKMNDYNKELKEYKQKVLQKLPAKKPKAPKWMKAHKGAQFVAAKIEKIEDGLSNLKSEVT